MKQNILTAFFFLFLNTFASVSISSKLFSFNVVNEKNQNTEICKIK